MVLDVGVGLLELVVGEELVVDGGTVEDVVELEGGNGAIMVVVAVLVDDIDEGGGGGVDEELDDVVVGVGVTMTTAVDTAIQPTPSHAYPGKQQPPPGF